ncbi:MAG: hypothetical protein RBG13Loki_4329 [Promethearchaeota archaeon CR_4]|nr:MAG: hypothetical protein RBG13Loki_4329 [Candidatus Lokiarchaeota archaeon CR_4]
MNNVSEKKGIFLTCNVRNCGASIEFGKEIRIGDKIYCGICGVAKLKSTFAIFDG